MDELVGVDRVLFALAGEVRGYGVLPDAGGGAGFADQLDLIGGDQLPVGAVGELAVVDADDALGRGRVSYSVQPL